MSENTKPRRYFRSKLREIALSGDVDQYVKCCQENVAFMRERIGETSMSAALALWDLADGYDHLGEYLKSLEAYRLAADIVAKRRGKDDAVYANYLASAANMLHKLERNQESEPLYREAIAIHERLQTASPKHWVAALTNLAMLCQQEGRIHESDELLLEASKVRGTWGSGKAPG